MRKVTASLFSTLDGVVEAPNEWQFAFDDEMGATISRMLDELDAVLLGRVTYTEWAAYWPTSTDEPFASWINRTPKYVASNTLDSVDQWPNSELIMGSVADFVAELRQQEGGTIGTGGSPSLVRAARPGPARRADAADSSRGRWRRPQTAGCPRRRVDQTRADRVKPTSSGVVMAAYRPAR